MIILNLYFGLGNQMFEYAYALALKEEYGDEVYINTSWSKLHTFIVNIKRILSKVPCEKYDLYCSNHLVNMECQKSMKRLSFPASIFHTIKFELLVLYFHFFKNSYFFGSENFKRMSSKGLFVSYDGFSYFQHGICNKKVKYVQGAFASDKYFRERIDFSVIKKIYTITAKPSSENENMLHRIRASNAICVHIRRGDYITDTGIAKHFTVCNSQYYSDAIDYIEKNVENPTYYIFSNNSDDLKWIKENYTFIKPDSVYVDLNNPDYEELRLMYNCKHFIMSNSTFSWWASYLSDNPDKIVLVPDVFHNQVMFDGSTAIYRDDMIKIHVNREIDK